MACQWEDEQTGGHCADLAQDFTGTSRKWFTFTNGAHIDSLDPATFDRWYDFLVAVRRAPRPDRNTRHGPDRGAALLPGGHGISDVDPAA